MNRRHFLGRAAAAGALGVPVIGIMRAQHAALAQPTTVSMKCDIERFERRVELIRQSLDIPGMSVAVLHQQALNFARGFGVVDLAKDTKATENTPYPIASLTKTFAAAVIMRLVEAGKLELDEAMSTYDPGYAAWCADIKKRGLAAARNYNCDSRRVTVRHHLTHTCSPINPIDGRWPSRSPRESPRDVEGWTRLMRSRVVLGESEVAATAFHKALEVFKDDSAASGKITAAANELGLKAE
jgi:CubicO group peptidase (beta-lactamase class C family)